MLFIVIKIISANKERLQKWRVFRWKHNKSIVCQSDVTRLEKHQQYESISSLEECSMIGWCLGKSPELQWMTVKYNHDNDWTVSGMNLYTEMTKMLAQNSNIIRKELQCNQWCILGSLYARLSEQKINDHDCLGLKGLQERLSKYYCQLKPHVIY